MQIGTLVLVTDTPASATAVPRSVEAALASAGVSPSAVTRRLISEVLADPSSALSGADAAWVVLASSDAGPLQGLLEVLHERHIPAALTRPAGGRSAGAAIDEGVVALPAGSSPAIIAAVLGTLVTQAALVRSVTQEARLLRAHHRNVADHLGKLDEELRMAVKIQREFLPKQLPQHDRFRFDVLWRPAHYVSGDIYDVIRLDEQHLGLFIADAVGHGVPAALMTMFIKQALTTKRIGGQHTRGYQLFEPAESLARLNQRLVEQEAGSACFATAIYAVLNTDTGAVRLARAGHPLPLLLRADGTTERIDADGPMLGVFETDDFQQSEFTLHRDDRLVLYSDGFEMAFPDPAARGGSIATDRYLAEFEMLRHGNAREAMQQLADLLDTQTGSLNQRDDLTLLCTTRTAAANVNAVPAAAPLRAAG